MRCIFPITQRSGKDRQVREQDACRGRDADQRKASRLLSDGEIEIHREDPDRDYKNRRSPCAKRRARRKISHNHRSHDRKKQAGNDRADPFADEAEHADLLHALIDMIDCAEDRARCRDADRKSRCRHDKSRRGASCRVKPDIVADACQNLAENRSRKHIGDRNQQLIELRIRDAVSDEHAVRDGQIRVAAAK